MRYIITVTALAGLITISSELTAARIVTIANSNFSACVLLDNGRINCWGDGRSGKLGNGMNTNIGDESGEMGDKIVPVDLGHDFSPVDIQGGHEFLCALSDRGQVKCWGDNIYGQLGTNDVIPRGEDLSRMGDALRPLPLGDGFVVKQLAVGASHACALSMKGEVKCWGNGEFGLLGSQDILNIGSEPGSMEAIRPVDLGKSANVREVRGGLTMTCAILGRDVPDEDDLVKCWGYDTLGSGSRRMRGAEPGSMGDSLPAVMLGVRKPIKKIVVGYDFGCALFTDGLAKCWGSNSVGQLATGDLISRGLTPSTVGEAIPFMKFDREAKIDDFFSGPFGSSVCAILDSGAFKCTGYNTYGQLGIGSKKNQGGGPESIYENMKTTDLGAFAEAKFAVVADYFMCAVTKDDIVKCFGEGTSGKLGQGDTKSYGSDEATTGANVSPVAYQ